MAFLAAIASPDELRGVGHHHGSRERSRRAHSKNARKALELAHRTDIPVFAGAAAPLVRPLITAEHVHGRTGFDGYELPEPTTSLKAGFAPEVIVELVMSRPAKAVTLCCLAPLTNVALAMAREPRLASHLAGIVLMGGSVWKGATLPRPLSSISTSIRKPPPGSSRAVRRSP